MKNIIDRAQGADTIYLPKGEREQPNVIKWLQDVADIDVPAFQDRQLVVRSAGKTFAIVRAADSLRLVEEDENSVGSVGTEKFKEFQLSKPGWNTAVRICPIGPKSCSIALLAPESTTEDIKTRIKSERLTVATSLPNIAQNYARRKGANFIVRQFSGSIEALPQLGKADAIVDIVDSGETMRKNNLEIIDTISAIYPGLIWRSDSLLPDNEQAPAFLDTAGILAAVQTIRSRAERVIDRKEEPETYSERLLVSINEMLKKFGSEQAEVIKAYLTEDDGALLNEAADNIYSLMLLLASRDLNLIQVLNILAQRNVPKVSKKGILEK